MRFGLWRRKIGACDAARAHLELLKGLVFDWKSMAIPTWNITETR